MFTIYLLFVHQSSFLSVCTPVCFVCPYTTCSAGIGQVAEVVEDDKNSAMEEDDFLEHEIAIGGENENEEETLLWTGL